MLTKTEITAEPNTLDETDVEMWLALIKANEYYRMNKVFYPDILTELENASGSVKGSMLNAILNKIEALGPGEASIVGGDEGLNWSQSQERDALVKYGLSILYDAVEVVEVTTTTTSTSAGSFGSNQVRQRGPAGACLYCSCYGYHHSWCNLSPYRIG